MDENGSDGGERLATTSDGQLAPGARVAPSNDAGGFYCEHALYVALRTAAAVPCLHGSRGPRVGFLHVPVDPLATGADEDTEPLRADRKVRQHATAQVLGLALRSLCADARDEGADGELRVLLSGFGPFRSIRDNPSGAFVADPALLTAVLWFAWGPVGVTEHSDVAAGERRLRCSQGGASLSLHALHLSVEDAALDQLAARIRGLQPHVVVCMGVHSGETEIHRVETRASDRNLRWDGGYHHEEDRPAGEVLEAPLLWAALSAARTA